NQAGMKLTPRQLFEYSSIAELAEVAAVSERREPELEELAGTVELTPIQERFFQQAISHRSHYNQAVMLETTERLESAVMRKVVNKLLMHHDALRLRYWREGGEWKQEVCLPTLDDVVTMIDLSELPAGEKGGAIAEAAEQVQRSLDIEAGPIVRVGVFEMGAGEAARLEVVIHHLAIDGVSWRILLEDLKLSYQQARRGEEIELARKTSSYQRWARALKEYGEKEEVSQELSYWLGEQRRAVEPMPVDRQGGANLEKDGLAVLETLSA